GGLDLLGADGVLGGARRVGVLDRAADGAGVAVGEIDGELGGDPGESATAQGGLGVGPLLRGAQGGGGLLVGGLDLLLLCRGGGDGLLAFLRGAQRETCVPEGGRRRASLVPGGDLLGAPGGSCLELFGEGGEGGGRGGELFAACGELLLACGQGLLELDELLQRAGRGGGLVGRGDQLLGGLCPLQQVHELRMPRAGAARELREGLDRGGGLGGGGVAAAQHLDDGARGLVALEGGARGVEGGLLALEPLGEGVELASAVDALQRGDGGVRRGPRGLFGAPRLLGGYGGLVGPRGHGGEVLLGEF